MEVLHITETEELKKKINIMALVIQADEIADRMLCNISILELHYGIEIKPQK